MRLWSKGLGKLILPLELDQTRTDLTPEHIVFSGTIRDGKIVWPYYIRMGEEDLVGFTQVLLRRDVLDFLARRSGLALLWTIFTASIAFAGGVLRTLLGKGYAVKGFDDLGLGSKAQRPRGKRLRQVASESAGSGPVPGPAQAAGEAL